MNPTGAFEQAGLGFKYRKGDGVVKDDAEAARWFTKFAEQGFVLAQPQLAQCYLNGEGVEKSYAEFVKWTKRAAEQGLPESQVHLGLALASGMEITKDLKTAYMWFNIAAASGNPEAKKKAEKFRSEVARSMSQSDIAEAQRMSRMWKPKSEPQS